MNNPNAGCCRICGSWFSEERKALGYDICLWCGEEEALTARRSWCVAPMHKSNYQLVTNPQDLKAMNPKQINTTLEEYLAALNNVGESKW